MQDRDFSKALNRAKEPVAELGSIAQSVANGGGLEPLSSGYERVINVDYTIRRTEFENDPLWEPFGRLVDFYKSGRGTKIDITESQVKTNSVNDVKLNLNNTQSTGSKNELPKITAPYIVTDIKALSFDYFKGVFGFTGNLLLSNYGINAGEFVEYRNKDVTNENVDGIRVLEDNSKRRLTEYLVRCAGFREYDAQYEAARGILYIDSKHPNVWIIRVEGVKTLRPFMAVIGYI